MHDSEIEKLYQLVIVIGNTTGEELFIRWVWTGPLYAEIRNFPMKTDVGGEQWC